MASLNGVEIPRTEWKTQKAEKLFKLLLLIKDKHPKEKIIDELWPDPIPRPEMPACAWL